MQARWRRRPTRTRAALHRAIFRDVPSQRKRPERRPPRRRSAAIRANAAAPAEASDSPGGASVPLDSWVEFSKIVAHGAAVRRLEYNNSEVRRMVKTLI